MTYEDLYVVTGRTGEWEDVYEWDVISYTDKSKADTLCADLEGTIDNFLAKIVKTEDFDGNIDYEILEDLLKPLDPHLNHIDYNGVSYYVRKIKFGG